MWHSASHEIRPLELHIPKFSKPKTRQWRKSRIAPFKSYLMNAALSWTHRWKKKERKGNQDTWQVQLKMLSQGMWEQQSHSHGSVPGTAKVRRTAGNPVSLQQTPDVHISPALSPSLFLFSVSTSLPSERAKKKKKEKNWQRCVPVVKLVVFFANCFLALSHASSQMWPIWTKLCRNNPDEPSELKIEILVFLKGFRCNGFCVSSALQTSLYYGVVFTVFRDRRLKQL